MNSEVTGAGPAAIPPSADGGEDGAETRSGKKGTRAARSTETERLRNVPGGEGVWEAEGGAWP